MSSRDENPDREETPSPREFGREARRLARLRLVEVRDIREQDERLRPLDDFDPDPKEAA
jgi:hypothetical protein